MRCDYEIISDLLLLRIREVAHTLKDKLSVVAYKSLEDRENSHFIIVIGACLHQDRYQSYSATLAITSQNLRMATYRQSTTFEYYDPNLTQNILTTIAKWMVEIASIHEARG